MTLLTKVRRCVIYCGIALASAIVLIAAIHFPYNVDRPLSTAELERSHGNTMLGLTNRQLRQSEKQSTGEYDSKYLQVGDRGRGERAYQRTSLGLCLKVGTARRRCAGYRLRSRLLAGCRGKLHWPRYLVKRQQILPQEIRPGFRDGHPSFRTIRLMADGPYGYSNTFRTRNNPSWNSGA